MHDIVHDLIQQGDPAPHRIPEMLFKRLQFRCDGSLDILELFFHFILIAQLQRGKVVSLLPSLFLIPCPLSLPLALFSLLLALCRTYGAKKCLLNIDATDMSPLRGLNIDPTLSLSLSLSLS